jgi:hypothetical protein
MVKIHMMNHSEIYIGGLIVKPLKRYGYSDSKEYKSIREILYD